MKVFEIFRLNIEEQKLIMRVFYISSSVCVLFIAIAWTLQHFSAKSDNTETLEIQAGEKKKKGDKKVQENNLLPIDVNAHKYAAERLNKEKKYHQSVEHLLRIQQAENADPQTRFLLATTYLKGGMYQEAVDMYTPLIESGIRDSVLMDKVMSRYGLTLFHLGKIEESINQLDQTLELFPWSAEANCYKGQIEASLNLSSPKAEKYLKKSVELNPQFAESYYQLARYYMNKPDRTRDNLANARLYLKKHLEIEPLNPKAHSRLGMIYYYLEEPDLAEKSYETALSLNENDYNTHYNLGELYYTFFDNPQKALGEFLKAVKIKENHEEANFKIGLISLENNDYKEAIRFLTKARNSSPTNLRVLFQLAVAYELNGMKSKAISVYNTIIEFDALNDIAIQKLKLLGYRN